MRPNPPKKRRLVRPARRHLAPLPLLIFAAAILASGPATPRADGRAVRADELTQFFDQIALGLQPRWLRRWNGPVTVRLSGEVRPAFRARLDRSLADISRWTGLSFTRAGRRANAGGRNRITIHVVPHAEMRRRHGREGKVCTATTYGRNGRLHTARVVISARYTDCLDHELMHALGFDGHWTGGGGTNPIGSVLAPRYAPNRSFRFTRFDVTAIRTLYHRRLWPGMRRGRALAQARRLFQPPQL